MKAPNQKLPRTLTPAGTFIARVTRIIYIGTIKETYMGEEKEMPKLMLTWELPTETHIFREEDGPKPFTISKEYTHSMGKKSNLRPITEAIIGTSLTDDEAYAFDHDELLGLACQVTIIHDEKESGTWEKVTAVSPLLKGIQCPPQVNPSKVLSFDKWDEELFEKLPQFIKNKIVTSKEYRKMKGQTEEIIRPEDIPF
jgi:hypothetical protein